MLTVTRPRVRRLVVGVALLASLACGSRPEVETIVVPGDVNHEALHALQRARGRPLTREEMLELHRVWIDDEVLYREGLKRAPSPGADRRRERVVARALAALDDEVRPASVSDAELRSWFERRRESYARPARFDFEEAALPGRATEAAARALAAELDAGAPPTARVSLRAFRGRPESNLVQSYGPDVATALRQAEVGRWRALETREGWRVLRLTAREPALPATFEAARAAVRRDFIEAAAAEGRAAAVRALWKKYEIVLEETVECLADKG